MSAADRFHEGTASLSSCILIVDASIRRSEAIPAILSDAGYTNLLHAGDCDEALASFSRFNPLLVVLDASMSRKEGLQLCRDIRVLDDGATPILVQSRPHEKAQWTQAFAAGATDFLPKPVQPPELLARVGVYLEHRQLVGRFRLFQQRIKDELSAARAMQDMLLPPQLQLDTIRADAGVDIAGHFETSSELGGDLWGLQVIDDSRLGVFVADFSGHGLAAALNSFRLHTLLAETSIFAHLGPEQVLEVLNERLTGLLPRGTFATAFYGVVDLDHDRLDYAAAGAPPPVLFRGDGASIATESRGLPLGIHAGHSYSRRSLPFPPGAGLLLYSDAVLESPDACGDVWTQETIRRRIAGLDLSGDTAIVLRSILAGFLAGRTRPLPDDLTLVCLRRMPVKRS